MDKDGRYEKWSEFEKMEELNKYFSEVKKLKQCDIFPKISQFDDGTLAAFHDWTNINAEQIKKERIDEMFWYYCAGIFEGINEKHIKNIKNKSR